MKYSATRETKCRQRNVSNNKHSSPAADEGDLNLTFIREPTNKKKASTVVVTLQICLSPFSSLSHSVCGCVNVDVNVYECL